MQSMTDEPLEQGGIQLFGNIWMFPDKKLSKNGKIFKGEIRSGIFGCRPVILKLAIRNKQSITEAKILIKLNHHSHILPILQADNCKGVPFDYIFLVLEKCHGENLHEFINNQKNQCTPFDLKGALEIVNQIIDGMIHIHDNKIIHKDIAPHNILFSADQKTIRIAGFGSSVEIESVSAVIFEEAECKNSTPGYRPPEFYENNKALISQKSDIFSLGATIYFVLTNGENPFGDDPDIWVHNIKMGIISLKHSYLSNMETTEHYIKHMIEHKPDNRPTIWQVSEQPCWTGSEVECNFDYAPAEASKSTSSTSAMNTRASKDDIKTTQGESFQGQDIREDVEQPVVELSISDLEKDSKNMEVLSCPICLNSFSSAKILQCGHVFCLTCLKQSVKDERIGCSLCCTVHNLPKNGCEGFFCVTVSPGEAISNDVVAPSLLQQQKEELPSVNNQSEFDSEEFKYGPTRVIKKTNRRWSTQDLILFLSAAVRFAAILWTFIEIWFQ